MVERYVQGRFGMTPTKDGDFVKYEDHKQALAEKDKGSITLQERIAYYDRWLSNGVYYTNDEFLERVLKPRQQLMEKAVRFAMALTCDEDLDIRACTTARDFLTSPEVQTWRMQQLEVKE